MIVAASTTCLPDSSLQETLDRLADLEYTNAELVIGTEGALTPELLATKFDALVHLCNSLRRITPVAIYFDIEPTHEKYMEYFKIACHFAKAIRVVVITVHASVPGTPFNEEVERLNTLVGIGISHGVVIGLLTEVDRMTDCPDTVGSLCKSIKGLGVTLDPSHYTVNLPKPKDFENILPFVCHVRLRDSSDTQYQVKIGQGILEFGKLVIQLNKNNYRRTLCIDLKPMPEVDTQAELRKMRLLLESLL